VQWLAAVQAQDYAGAKWAVGMRLPGSTDADVEAAFNRGTILRTHVLRPTWHFVAPADIRWLLALTAPRVHAANAHMYRTLDLDARISCRSDATLSKALEGGQHLTRAELRTVLQRQGIATGAERMAYLVMHAELEGVVCSGPRRGKQFTYALLEERVPAIKAITRDEALRELAGRFFTSRGPATVQDLAKWSGLTVADARRGVESAKRRLEHEVIDGTTYWYADSKRRTVGTRAPAAHLLSIYDEYICSYREGSAIIGAGHTARRSGTGESGLYIAVVNGGVVGRWSRTFAKGRLAVRIHLYHRLRRAAHRAVKASAKKFGAFMQMPIELQVSEPDF